MWQRFTERARKVVFYAQEEAQRFGEGYVSTEHILLGLIRETDSVAARVLERLGVACSRVKAEVEKQLPRGDARPAQDMSLTPRAKRVIDLAYEEARALNNNYIGTEHLLLGLVREEDGLAARVLTKLGVELDRARREVMELQDNEKGAATGGYRRPFDRVTRLASAALDWAQWEAEMFADPEAIGVRHILLGMVRFDECVAMRLLKKLGVDDGGLYEALDAGRGHRERPTKAYLAYDKAAEAVLAEAENLTGDGFVGTEHVMLAVLGSPDLPETRLLLERFKVSKIDFEEALNEFNSQEPRG